MPEGAREMDTVHDSRRDRSTLPPLPPPKAAAPDAGAPPATRSRGSSTDAKSRASADGKRRTSTASSFQEEELHGGALEEKGRDPDIVVVPDAVAEEIAEERRHGEAQETKDEPAKSPRRGSFFARAVGLVVPGEGRSRVSQMLRGRSVKDDTRSRSLTPVLLIHRSASESKAFRGSAKRASRRRIDKRVSRQTHTKQRPSDDSAVSELTSEDANDDAMYLETQSSMGSVMSEPAPRAASSPVRRRTTNQTVQDLDLVPPLKIDLTMMREKSIDENTEEPEAPGTMPLEKVLCEGRLLKRTDFPTLTGWKWKQRYVQIRVRANRRNTGSMFGATLVALQYTSIDGDMSKRKTRYLTQASTISGVKCDDSRAIFSVRVYDDPFDPSSHYQVYFKTESFEAAVEWIGVLRGVVMALIEGTIHF